MRTGVSKIYLCCLFVFSVQAHVHVLELKVRSHNRSEAIDEIYEHVRSGSHQRVLVEVLHTASAVMFMPYLELLKEYNATIILKAPESIRTLLSWYTCVDELITDTTTSYDLHMSLEDFAHFCIKKNITPQTPARMTPEETLVALWQDQLVQDMNYKVGVCCNLFYASPGDSSTTLTLNTLLPIAQMHALSLYSFDDITDDTIPDSMHIYTFSKKIRGSLADYAAIIQELDLIVTTEPIIAHIAGALQKNAWYFVDTTHTHVAVNCPTVTTYDLSLCNPIEIVLQKLMHIEPNVDSTRVTAEVAIGELIDKITILEIKTERIDDEQKLKNIWNELNSLQATFAQCTEQTPELMELVAELKAANEALWTTEDLIRDKERVKCFDDEFILLARMVYRQNDERCRVKRKINELLGSRLIEEKSYKPY